MMKSRFSASSRGNVLFLILIAVMLFAALTAAITRSDRGANSLDRERGSIDASDLMGFGSAVEKSVARMLSTEISESAISFENPVWLYYDGNQVETAALFGNCTSGACKVFDPAGGGLGAQTFGGQIIDSPVATDVQSGNGVVYSLGVAGVGSSAKDLVLMIAVVDQNTCRSINNQLNITNPAGAPPADSWTGAALYNGTFGGAGDGTGTIGDTATELVGRPAGCVTRTGGAYGTQDNYFYQVLLPR